MINRIASLPFAALLLAGLLFITGCDLTPLDSDTINVETSDVVVANAGAFGGQNSSFTFIDPNVEEGGAVTRGEGEFASYIQSHILLDERYLAVFGETASIGLFDLETQDQLGLVEGIPNPRYAISDGAVAYVTSKDFSGEGQPGVYVVDVANRAVVDTTLLDRNPEGLTGTQNEIYVTTGEQDGEIVVINRANNEIVNRIDPECDTPRQVYRTAEENLAVACTGATIFDEDFNVVEETDGAIRIIDRANGEILAREDLSGQLTSASAQQRVFFTRILNELYVVLNGNTVVRYDASTGNREDIAIEGPPIGAIAVDAVNEVMYLGRPDEANPFGAAGVVTVNEFGGAELTSYDAGIAPGHIALRITQSEQ